MTIDRDKTNDLFHLLTWRSPLRKAGIRRIIRPIAALMAAGGDPGLAATGLVIEALVDQFEKGSKKGG